MPLNNEVIVLPLSLSLEKPLDMYPATRKTV